MLGLINSTIKSNLDRYFNSFLNSKSKNIEYQLQINALLSTSKYIEQKMKNTSSFENKYELLNEALKQAENDGLFCEFGVYKGKTINYIASKQKDIKIYGFDSFEGLPEFWRDGFAPGKFSNNGIIPTLLQNVTIYKGWFNETLPQFLDDHSEKVSFIHIDCDLYSSTKTVLDLLEPRITKGTVIAFDEYFNYPFWSEHEYKAFQEYVLQNNIKYQYIGFNRYHEQVAVKVI